MPVQAYRGLVGAWQFERDAVNHRPVNVLGWMTTAVTFAAGLVAMWVP